MEIYNKVERVHKLVGILNYHRDLYYNEACPEIADTEYDKMFDELQKLENETGVYIYRIRRHKVLVQRW